MHDELNLIRAESATQTVTGLGFFDDCNAVLRQEVVARVTLNDRDQEILNHLEGLTRNGMSAEDAIKALKKISGDPSRVDRIVEHQKQLAQSILFFSLGKAVHDAEEYGQGWYTGVVEDRDVFWPALRRHLYDDPKWAGAVPSLDSASTEVVSLLHDPKTDRFATRGLVVGYVQSGKTANFTATIAKAADAGYRLFIVLSGVHNALRRQTQLRMDQHLVDLSPERWVPLTSEHGDFGNPVRALPILSSSDLRSLAVVKKNASRLSRLCDWLDSAEKRGVLDNCPILVIDDEADQATPNAAANAWQNATRIHELTKRLVKRPKVAYVGYTATPYANVLMNASVTDGLYPKHFMFSLPKPYGYFGGEELFGAEDAVEDEAPAAHDMIRYVAESDIEALADVHSAADTSGAVKSLEEAVRWFIMATAARRFRGQGDSHSSMLIHTSARAADHQNMRLAVRALLKRLTDSWKSGETGEWSKQWNQETAAEPAVNHDLVAQTFDSLLDPIGSVLSDAAIVVDNYLEPTPERLMYGDDPAVVIVIGGNVLSRGLTLEGLVTSYFVRRSGQYDALLQMGRWFGYRPGYSDLPRIWTTRELEDRFRFLSLVESEVRRDINRYRDENVSPSQAAVRIRTHPAMTVTARNKMQFAVEGGTSYGGQHPQTTYFNHRDLSIIHRNRDAVKGLIAAAVAGGANRLSVGNNHLLEGVSVEDVLRCVGAFRFHGDTALDRKSVTDYIAEENRLGNLRTWNVAVISKKSTPEDAILDLGSGLRLPCLVRSKLDKRSGHDTAGIGTLMSRADRWVDLGLSEASTDQQILDARFRSQRGLIAIYPIDKDSHPRASAKGRSTLEAADHLIGLGFAFPPAHPDNSITATVQLDPTLLSNPIGDPTDNDDTETDHVVKGYDA